jgi:hypothetical protein
MGPITLRVVCPSGAGLLEEGLDEVVFHRREERDEPGSYVSIRPSHGSLLARSAAGEITWRRGGTVGRAMAGAGVVVLASDVRGAK